MLKYIFSTAFICFTFFAHAQLNMKVGLSLGVVDDAFENEIIERYNLENDWLTQELDQLRFMPGIDLGFRYRFDGVAFDLSWKNKFQNLDGEGVDPATNAEFVRDLFYTINSYSAGLDFYIKNFVFGGSIDRMTYAVKSKNTGDSDRRITVRDFTWGSHFFIGYEIETSSKLSLSLRPFVQMTWQDVNLFGVEEELFPETGADVADFNTNFRQFGIMLLFYNGRK